MDLENQLQTAISKISSMSAAEIRILAESLLKQAADSSVTPDAGGTSEEGTTSSDPVRDLLGAIKQALDTYVPLYLVKATRGIPDMTSGALTFKGEMDSKRVARLQEQYEEALTKAASFASLSGLPKSVLSKIESLKDREVPWHIEEAMTDKSVYDSLLKSITKSAAKQSIAKSQGKYLSQYLEAKLSSASLSHREVASDHQDATLAVVEAENLAEAFLAGSPEEKVLAKNAVSDSSNILGYAGSLDSKKRSEVVTGCTRLRHLLSEFDVGGGDPYKVTMLWESLSMILDGLNDSRLSDILVKVNQKLDSEYTSHMSKIHTKKSAGQQLTSPEMALERKEHMISGMVSRMEKDLTSKIHDAESTIRDLSKSGEDEDTIQVLESEVEHARKTLKNLRVNADPEKHGGVINYGHILHELMDAMDQFEGISPDSSEHLDSVSHGGLKNINKDELGKNKLDAHAITEALSREYTDSRKGKEWGWESPTTEAIARSLGYKGSGAKDSGYAGSEATETPEDKKIKEMVRGLAILAKGNPTGLEEHLGNTLGESGSVQSDTEAEQNLKDLVQKQKDWLKEVGNNVSAIHHGEMKPGPDRKGRYMSEHIPDHLRKDYERHERDRADNEMLVNSRKVDERIIRHYIFDPTTQAQTILNAVRAMGNGVVRAENVKRVILEQLDYLEKSMLTKDSAGQTQRQKAAEDESNRQHEALAKDYGEFDKLNGLLDLLRDGYETTLTELNDALEAKQTTAHPSDSARGDLDKALPKAEQDKLIKKIINNGRNAFNKAYLDVSKVGKGAVAKTPEDEVSHLEQLLHLPKNGTDADLDEDDLVDLLASTLASTKLLVPKVAPEATPPKTFRKLVTSPVIKGQSPYPQSSGTSIDDLLPKKDWGMAKKASWPFWHAVQPNPVEPIDQNTPIAQRIKQILAGDGAEKLAAGLTKRLNKGDASGNLFRKITAEDLEEAVRVISSDERTLAKIRAGIADGSMVARAPKRRNVPEQYLYRHPKAPGQIDLDNELENSKSLLSMYTAQRQLMRNHKGGISEMEERVNRKKTHHEETAPSLKGKIESHNKELEEVQKRIADWEKDFEAMKAEEAAGNVNPQRAHVLSTQKGKLDKRVDTLHGMIQKKTDRLKHISDGITKDTEYLESLKSEDESVTPVIKALTDFVNQLEAESKEIIKLNKSGLQVHSGDLEKTVMEARDTYVKDRNLLKQHIDTVSRRISDRERLISSLNREVTDEADTRDVKLWARDMVRKVWQKIMDEYQIHPTAFKKLTGMGELEYEDIFHVVNNNVGLMNDKRLVRAIWDNKKRIKALNDMMYKMELLTKKQESYKEEMSKGIELVYKLDNGVQTQQRFEDLKKAKDHYLKMVEQLWTKLNTYASESDIVEATEGLMEAAAEAGETKALAAGDGLPDPKTVIKKAERQKDKNKKEAEDKLASLGSFLDSLIGKVNELFESRGLTKQKEEVLDGSEDEAITKMATLRVLQGRVAT